MFAAEIFSHSPNNSVDVAGNFSQELATRLLTVLSLSKYLLELTVNLFQNGFHCAF
jgi:hypothetical protein